MATNQRPETPASQTSNPQAPATTAKATPALAAPHAQKEAPGQNAPATEPGADPKEVKRAQDLAKAPSPDEINLDANTVPLGDESEEEHEGIAYVVLHVQVTDHNGSAWRRGRVIWIPEGNPVASRLVSLKAVRRATAEESRYDEVEIVEDEAPSFQNELAALHAELQEKNQRIALLEAEKAKR